jgi:hypothetical protein
MGRIEKTVFISCRDANFPRVLFVYHKSSVSGYETTGKFLSKPLQ